MVEVSSPTPLHLYLLDHEASATMIVEAKKWWNELDEEEQRAAIERWDELKGFERSLSCMF